MEKLFENTTIYTPEIYSEFVKFHNKKYNLKYNLYTLAVLACIVFCMVTQFLSSNIFMGVFFAIIMGAFLFYRVYHPYFFTKKEASSDKVQKHMKNTYSFYDKYMKVQSNKTFTKLKYYKLYKFFETENYFYLYINKNYSFVLDKSTFSIGNPNSFSKFMKKKIWYKI